MTSPAASPLRLLPLALLAAGVVSAGCAGSARESAVGKRVLSAPVTSAPMKLAVVARGSAREAAVPPPAPLDVVEPLSPSIIYFEFDHYKVSSRYRDVLMRHVLQLKANPALRLEVQGHTDDLGPKPYNEALARKRAEMVMRELTELGAPRAQLELVAFGSTLPPAAATDGPLDARARSRRVELVYR